MPDDFTHDVFLSHSSKDKAVVRAVAERFRADGLRVWLDDREKHLSQTWNRLSCFHENRTEPGDRSLH